MNTGDRKYWKSYAKRNLSGNWGIAIAAMLAVAAVNLVGNIFAVKLFPGDTVLPLVLSEIFVFVVSLIGMIFSTGYSYMQLNICRGREYKLGNLLYMFHNQPDRVLVAGLVVALLNELAQIPFCYVTYMVNPGSTMEGMLHWYQLLLGAWLIAMVLSVILTVPFALTFYFLADNPEMGGIEALKVSMHAMKGHIWQYLMLELSFVPLFFLSILTLYIGLLWLVPYMQFSETAFYMYVTGELDQQKQAHDRGEREKIEQCLSRDQEETEELTKQNKDDYNSEA